MYESESSPYRPISYSGLDAFRTRAVSAPPSSCPLGPLGLWDPPLDHLEGPLVDLVDRARGKQVLLVGAEAARGSRSY
jgi:hypothetical protein